MQQTNFLRTNKIIYLALLVGMLVFAAVAFFLNENSRILKLDAENPFSFVVPIVLFVGITAGKFMFNTLMKKMEHAKSMQEKIGIYTSSSLIQYAFIEGAVMLSIVTFMMSGNLFFLIFMVVGVLYFLSLMPNPDKIAKQMNLSYDEKGELGIK